MGDSEDSTGDILLSAAAMIILGLLLLAAGVGCMLILGGLGSMYSGSSPRGYQGSSLGFLTFALGALFGFGSGGWLSYSGIRVIFKVITGNRDHDD